MPKSVFSFLFTLTKDKCIYPCNSNSNVTTITNLGSHVIIYKISPWIELACMYCIFSFSIRGEKGSSALHNMGYFIETFGFNLLTCFGPTGASNMVILHTPDLCLWHTVWNILSNHLGMESFFIWGPCCQFQAASPWGQFPILFTGNTACICRLTQSFPPLPDIPPTASAIRRLFARFSFYPNDNFF